MKCAKKTVPSGRRHDPLRTIWPRIEERHKRAVRMVALTFYLGDAECWPRLALVLLSRLTETERAMLAWATLRSLDPEPRELVSEMALWGTATCVEPSPFNTPEFLGSCEEYHRTRKRRETRRSAVV